MRFIYLLDNNDEPITQIIYLSRSKKGTSIHFSCCVKGLRNYTHTHTHTHTHTQRHTQGHTRTRRGLARLKKLMAQQSPGHNASLHPLISAESTERRRKKKRGGDGEVGGQRAQKKKRGREDESGGRDRKMNWETRRGSNKKRKGRKSARGKRGWRRRRRRMTHWGEEKEECMFASHLQWRRTAWQSSDACWMTISPPLSGGCLFFFFFLPSFPILSFLGREHFASLALRRVLEKKLTMRGDFHTWQSIFSTAIWASCKFVRPEPIPRHLGR